MKLNNIDLAGEEIERAIENLMGPKDLTMAVIHLRTAKRFLGISVYDGNGHLKKVEQEIKRVMGMGL